MLQINAIVSIEEGRECNGEKIDNDVDQKVLVDDDGGDGD